MNRSKRCENLGCLQGYKPADRDVPVANLLESRDGRCVGPCAPALSHAKRLQAQLPRSATRPELRGQLQSNVLTFTKIRRNTLRWQCVQSRLKIEDDVVDGNSKIEIARRVELQDLVDAVRRYLLPNIGECATVAQRGKTTPVRSVQAKELSRADSKQSMPLRHA